LYTKEPEGGINIMAKLTKTQKKNMLNSVLQKSKRLMFLDDNLISANDYIKIVAIHKKAMAKLK
jgi:hypothetical protein